MRTILAAYALVVVTAASARAATKGTDGDATFAAALHGALRAHAGNLFYSPASLRIALAMAAAGARGETATQMHQVLALPSGDVDAAIGKQLADWAALANPLLPSTSARDPQTERWQAHELEQKRVVLRVVNRLWAQAGHTFREVFLKLLRDDYGAPLGTVDFQQDTARVAINSWVAEATEQKIKELIANRIPGDTGIVITNAVYFKAHWQEEFWKSATHDQPFFTAGGKQTKVPLMRQVGHMSLARLDGAMMVELPYGDGRLAMDVVLPKARDGITRIEQAYVKGAFPRWVEALSTARVEVMLPRFRTSSSFEVAAKLAALGMPRAFKSGDADFSGIDGTRDLFIGAVVHQAFVDVDEYGTEAAAATVVGYRMTARAPTEEPVVFRADHPFLFFIRDTQANVVLFAGRLADPSAN